MQADMAAAQEALGREVIEVSAGGGAVKISITGDLVVKAVAVDPEAIDPDEPELLNDLLVAAINQAVTQAQASAAAKMEAAGGELGAMGKSLGIPGL
ncbi:MAG: YbaB/EbfC family nucleoid-associated protein, partial [Solirubrobacteraceae bacterium]|nr:YbaB/EbfC family nucleoid-associated protein [Solirubrobacteraceae bacterium]